MNAREKGMFLRHRREVLEARERLLLLECNAIGFALEYCAWD